MGSNRISQGTCDVLGEDQKSSGLRRFVFPNPCLSSSNPLRNIPIHLLGDIWCHPSGSFQDCPGMDVVVPQDLIGFFSCNDVAPFSKKPLQPKRPRHRGSSPCRDPDDEDDPPDLWGEIGIGTVGRSNVHLFAWTHFMLPRRRALLQPMTQKWAFWDRSGLTEHRPPNPCLDPNSTRSEAIRGKSGG